ncbi:hypothetical protein ACFC3Z_12210 [Enterococcus thailandicus]|uniref:hypothetical protein n=1 Tax=Enterococcus thailandicus TaxID=417368 RepID=UPI0035DDDDC3
MKKNKLFITIVSVMFVVILSSCGTSSKNGSNSNDLLRPGTVWKESNLNDWAKIKVIDESTWEYSNDRNPDPVQVGVKRTKDYKEFETYTITNSGGVRKFLNETKKFIVVPFKDEDKPDQFVIMSVGKDSKNDHEYIVKLASTSIKYVLQKTSE